MNLAVALQYLLATSVPRPDAGCSFSSTDGLGLTPMISADSTPQPPMPARDYYTRKELAHKVGVALRTVDEWIEKGLIPYMQMGPRLVRIPIQGLESALLKNTIFPRDGSQSAAMLLSERQAAFRRELLESPSSTLRHSLRAALGSDTWEYKILMMGGEMSDTGSLNALGAQGWELIFIKGAAAGIWYYLKRRRPNDKLSV